MIYYDIKLKIEREEEKMPLIHIRKETKENIDRAKAIGQSYDGFIQELLKKVRGLTEKESPPF